VWDKDHSPHELFPPGQGLKSGDNTVVNTIQFLTAVINMGRDTASLCPYK